jgi:hypothetical protein
MISFSVTHPNNTGDATAAAIGRLGRARIKTKQHGDLICVVRSGQLDSALATLIADGFVISSVVLRPPEPEK